MVESPAHADAPMLHARAFKVTVGWTLLLLLLGSIVHATQSSLACPDWPTCHGTMLPEMSGGVFWEHLHRLVAGGLVLMFCLATWLARKEATARPWVFRASLAGIGLLIVQSVFGGLTVLYRLPDLVSTTHLGLAFLFLSLATFLATATTRPPTRPMPSTVREHVWRLTTGAAVLVFVQSVLGALVRHTEAGMACPDVPLCLGRVVPPLVNLQITAHFTHRVLALVAATVVISIAIWARRTPGSEPVRRSLDAAALLVVAQVGLGVASVLSVLAVPPVALHTLFAAGLLATLVRVTVLAHRSPVASEAAVRTPATSGV